MLTDMHSQLMIDFTYEKHVDWNKEKVKVILKGVEELWASKSSGYKKVQLGTKKSVSLLYFKPQLMLCTPNQCMLSQKESCYFSRP